MGSASEKLDLLASQAALMVKNSLVKILMLGNFADRRRRGQQRIR